MLLPVNVSSTQGTAGNSSYHIVFVSIYLKCWAFGIGVLSSWFLFLLFSMLYTALSLNFVLLFSPVLPRKDFLKEQRKGKERKRKKKKKNPKHSYSQEQDKWRCISFNLNVGTNLGVHFLLPVNTGAEWALPFQWSSCKDYVMTVIKTPMLCQKPNSSLSSVSDRDLGSKANFTSSPQ